MLGPQYKRVCHTSVGSRVRPPVRERSFQSMDDEWAKQASRALVPLDISRFVLSVEGVTSTRNSPQTPLWLAIVSRSSRRGTQAMRQSVKSAPTAIILFHGTALGRYSRRRVLWGVYRTILSTVSRSRFGVISPPRATLKMRDVRRSGEARRYC
jgi:hypothetical protein